MILTRAKVGFTVLVIVLFLIAMAMFPTRSAPLSRPLPVPPPSVTLPIPEGPPTIESTRTYMVASIMAVDAYWDAAFAQSGVLFVPNPEYALVMPGEIYTSNCLEVTGLPLRVPSDYPNAFYCSVDGLTGTIVLPVTSFFKFFNFNVFDRYAPGAGYFSIAVIVAHEYGHYVQAILEVVYNLQVNSGKNKELLADCFSGTWTYGEKSMSNLRMDDYGEAIAVFSVIGDNVGSHGTNRERVDAYNLGFIEGSPLLCIDTYPMPIPLMPTCPSVSLPCAVGTVDNYRIDPNFRSSLSRLSR